MGLWLVQECRRHWQRLGQEHDYAELTRLAAAAPAGGSLINPEYAPFISPGEMPTKIEQFCGKSGQKAPADKGQFVRCCLESLALTYRRTIEGLEDILGCRLEVIHIVGGGSQNELLNQMTADACNRPVVAGPIEGTAIGNILVQALATGDIKSLKEARAIVRNSFPVKTYQPRDTAQWDVAYAKFAELVKITQ
jgi:rhamnulokinase